MSNAPMRGVCVSWKTFSIKTTSDHVSMVLNGIVPTRWRYYASKYAYRYLYSYGYGYGGYGSYTGYGGYGDEGHRYGDDANA